MDYFKNIKQNFDFLRNYGFKRERFTNGVDNEVVYRKASFEITIVRITGGKLYGKKR